MYNLAIRKCTSPPLLAPEIENFQMKIDYPARDRTPDPLNQRQTCYHLSQRGELKLPTASGVPKRSSIEVLTTPEVA